MATTSSITIANTSTGEEPVLPFVFDNKYKGDEVTKRCAEILGLPDTHGWSVVDTEEDTALVHYTEDADKCIYGHIRGLYLDLEVGAVIADSFGYTPTAVAAKITESDGNLAIKDKEGNNHIFDADTSVIKKVFEGVVIRVVWKNFKLKAISFKKINPARSRWGSSRYFTTMYNEAGGPTAEQLFDTTIANSSTCYDFLVVDQSLLVGTRQNVNKPYIVWLAQRTMDIKRPAAEVAPGVATFPTSDIKGGTVDESFIHDPKCLTLEEANHHLKFGYYNEFTVDDQRQLTGEAVIVYSVTDGVINDIVKIHSPAYEWRLTMRGDNPNIVNQFYTLLNIAYQDINKLGSWEAFKKRFILMPLYDEKSLKDLYTQTGGILTIPSGEVTQDDYSTRDSRIHLLWMNYVLSLPSHLQGNALDILPQFKRDRNSVIEWIQTLEADNKDIEAAEISSRAKGIITSSRRLARQRVSSGNNYSAKGSVMKLPLIIKSTIRNLVNKENGPSLYGLVREMKLALNPKPSVVVPDAPALSEVV